MTRSAADFKALTPIELELASAVIHDLLMTDFGLNDEWEMMARKALRAVSEGDQIVGVKVRLHPDACEALRRFASALDPGITETGSKRIRRIPAKCQEAFADYMRRPWFMGRVIPSGSSLFPELPAWYDGVFFATERPGTRPVILSPFIERVGGLKVATYTIEEVQWP